MQQRKVKKYGFISYKNGEFSISSEDKNVIRLNNMKNHLVDSNLNSVKSSQRTHYIIVTYHTHNLTKEVFNQRGEKKHKSILEIELVDKLIFAPKSAYRHTLTVKSNGELRHGSTFICRISNLKEEDFATYKFSYTFDETKINALPSVESEAKEVIRQHEAPSKITTAADDRAYYNHLINNKKAYIDFDKLIDEIDNYNDTYYPKRIDVQDICYFKAQLYERKMKMYSTKLKEEAERGEEDIQPAISSLYKDNYFLEGLFDDALEEKKEEKTSADYELTQSEKEDYLYCIDTYVAANIAVKSKQLTFLIRKADFFLLGNDADKARAASFLEQYLEAYENFSIEQKAVNKANGDKAKKLLNSLREEDIINGYLDTIKTSLEEYEMLMEYGEKLEALKQLVKFQTNSINLFNKIYKESNIKVSFIDNPKGTLLQLRDNMFSELNYLNMIDGEFVSASETDDNSLGTYDYAKKYRKLLMEETGDDLFKLETHPELKDVLLQCFDIDGLNEFESFFDEYEFIDNKLADVEKVLRVYTADKNTDNDRVHDILLLYYKKILFAFNNLLHGSRALLSVKEGKLYYFNNQYIYELSIINNSPKKRQDAHDIHVSATFLRDHYIYNLRSGESSGYRLSIPIEENPDQSQATIRCSYHYPYMTAANFVSDGPRMYKLIEDEWNDSITPITVKLEKKEKHVLTRDYINKFQEGGNIALDANSDEEDKGYTRVLENRREIIDKALDHIRSGYENKIGEWIMLFGQWRVGKTVILNYIEYELNKNHPNAIVIKETLTGSDKQNYDCYVADMLLYNIDSKLFTDELLSDSEDAGRIHRLFIEKCKEVGKYYKIEMVDEDDSLTSIDGLENAWQIFVDIIVRFNLALRTDAELKEQKTLVFLIDEFTDIYTAMIRNNLKRTKSFFEGLETLVNKGNVVFVSAGGEHSESIMVKHALNISQKMTPIPVGYLSKANVETYLHYVFGEVEEEFAMEDDAKDKVIVESERSYFDPEISDAAIDRIYELTQGNAYLLKRFVSEVIEILLLPGNENALLSKHVVESALSGMRRDENQEELLFDSLYNPYREIEEETDANSEISEELVCVKDNNLAILQGIIAGANPYTHRCKVTDLKDLLRSSNRFDMTKYQNVFETLRQREVIRTTLNGGKVFIPIDLYYEIAHERIVKNKEA